MTPFPPFVAPMDPTSVLGADVEVVVYLDFGDAATLTRAARHFVELTGRDDPTPDAQEGRHLYVLNFRCGPEVYGDVPDAPDVFVQPEGPADVGPAAWVNAYAYGMAQAAALLQEFGAHGIGGRVYAVRVQREGALFPATWQTGEETSDRISG